MHAAVAKSIEFAQRRPYAAIALVWLAIALPGLGAGWLWDRDETWYASSAMNMVLSGDWIVPAAGDRVFLEKPPLGYWGMALCFKVLGIGEFAARLPSVLWGLGTLWLTFAIARRQDGVRMGLAAAGFLGTTLMFTVLFSMAMLDPPLVFGMTGGMAAFWFMQDAREEREDGPPRYALLCLLGGLAVGAAFLAKGPLGLMPGMLALVYVVVKRDFSIFARANWKLLIGLVAIVVVGLPWYLAVWARTGTEFVDEFIMEQNLSRFTNPIQGHEGPFFYYIPVLLVTLLPWTPLALAAPFRRRKYDAFDLFLAVWAFVPVIFFSAMATKLIHYVAPCFPALAILLAREAKWRIEQGADAPRFAGWGAWFMAPVGLVLVGAGIAGMILLEGFPWIAFVVPGVVALVGFVTAGLAARRQSLQASLLTTGATLAAMVLFVKLFALDPASKAQALPTAALEMMDRAEAIDGDAAQGDLFTFAMFEPSLFFYTSGVMESGREDELEVRLAEMKPGETLLVMCRDKHVDNVQKMLPDGFTDEVDEVTTLRITNEELREEFRKEERFSVRILTIKRPDGDGG